MPIRQKITTCLWFDNDAEEAVNFYVSLFANSRIVSLSRYSEVGPGKPGSVMTIEFELEGQGFIAINGGPHFKLSEAVSLYIDCETQAEIDSYWQRLTANGGQESQCGWLKDRFGLSWQVSTLKLIEMVADPDRAKASRAFQAMLQMRKIDITALQRAYDGQ